MQELQVGVDRVGVEERPELQRAGAAVHRGRRAIAGRVAVGDTIGKRRPRRIAGWRCRRSAAALARHENGRRQAQKAEQTEAMAQAHDVSLSA